MAMPPPPPPPRGRTIALPLPRHCLATAVLVPRRPASCHAVSRPKSCHCPASCHAVSRPKSCHCSAGHRGRRLVFQRLPPPAPAIRGSPVAMGGFCPCLPRPTAPVMPSAPQPEEDSTVAEGHQALGAVLEPPTGPPLKAPPPTLGAPPPRSEPSRTMATQGWKAPPAGLLRRVAPPPGAEFGICMQGSPRGFEAPPPFKAAPKAPPLEWRSLAPVKAPPFKARPPGW